jgi:argininosuccinate lyase
LKILNMKLWGKTNIADSRVHRFTSEKDRKFDQLLALPDIIGSIAHARMLGSVGLISGEDAGMLERELKLLYRQAETGELIIDPDCEDIHSHIEMALTKKLGDTGRRIHTGRSRNDQVILAMRLFAREGLKDITSGMQELFGVLIQMAEKHNQLPMPGYTHMQLAMPSSFGLWFSAFAESLAEDLIPVHSAYRMMDQNPLGSGAGYGSSYPVDREMTTSLLGFSGMNVNAVYAQMSRTRAEITTAFALAAIASTLSRLSNDVCLYMGENYGLFSLPEAMTTGSSIMPHKKNPDVFELIRARCNRLQQLPAQLSAIAVNLPTGYHRDFQLFKESLLPAFTDLMECLSMAGMMAGQLRVSSPVEGNPLYDRMYSVEEINRLTQTGIPFREAHGLVARQIEAGVFKPDKRLTHTHTGSIGNLGLSLIREKWETNFRSINFDKADQAIRQIIGN